MENNKTAKSTWPIGRYFKYAIGEIVLVVVGILIALQINNWNQVRKDKNMIRDYISQIVDNLNTDIEFFKFNKEKYSALIKNKEWGMARAKYDVSQGDSLMSFMLIDITDNKVMDVAFGKLNNSGLTRFYEYDEIVNDIRNYYLISGKEYNNWVDWEIKWSDNELKWWHNNKDNFEWDFTDEFPNVNEENYNLGELIKVLESPKGRNQMYYALIRKRILFSQFESMHENAEELISRIHRALGETKS
jgi:hypothetical protein